MSHSPSRAWLDDALVRRAMRAIWLATTSARVAISPAAVSMRSTTSSVESGASKPKGDPCRVIMIVRPSYPENLPGARLATGGRVREAPLRDACPRYMTEHEALGCAEPTLRASNGARTRWWCPAAPRSGAGAAIMRWCPRGLVAMGAGETALGHPARFADRA